MSRGLEVDWVIIKVTSVRKLIAVLCTAVVATALLVFAYTRINLPPEAQARRAIERAEAAHQRVEENPVPELWQQEVAQALLQLDSAREAFVDERWQEATDHAEAARTRLESVLGAGKHKLAGVGQIFSFEGRVEVQRAGKSTWNDAHQNMPVFNGDFVKTGRDGSAEILFADGSLYRISSGSLLEIHQPQRSNERSAGGTVKMVVGRINVYTSGAPSTITTNSTETQVERDSRVAVRVGDDNERTTVAAYSGRARVRNNQGQEVVVSTREQVAADKAGTFSDTSRIPYPPAPLSPQNNAAFDVLENPIVELLWRAPPSVNTVYLQVSRSKNFNHDRLEIDRATPRRDGARLRALSAGTYYWRLAAGTPDGVESEWSSVSRFQVHSASRRLLPDDREPPELELTQTQQLGHLYIVEGVTEVGATVSINDEPVELDSEGRFRKTVEFTTEGWNELVVIAVDPSGNPTERRERVFVEF